MSRTYTAQETAQFLLEATERLQKAADQDPTGAQTLAKSLDPAATPVGSKNDLRKKKKTVADKVSTGEKHSEESDKANDASERHGTTPADVAESRKIVHDAEAEKIVRGVVPVAKGDGDLEKAGMGAMGAMNGNKNPLGAKRAGYTGRSMGRELGKAGAPAPQAPKAPGMTPPAAPKAAAAPIAPKAPTAPKMSMAGFAKGDDNLGNKIDKPSKEKPVDADHSVDQAPKQDASGVRQAFMNERAGTGVSTPGMHDIKRLHAAQQEHAKTRAGKVPGEKMEPKDDKEPQKSAPEKETKMSKAEAATLSKGILDSLKSIYSSAKSGAGNAVRSMQTGGARGTGATQQPGGVAPAPAPQAAAPQAAATQPAMGGQTDGTVAAPASRKPTPQENYGRMTSPSGVQQAAPQEDPSAARTQIGAPVLEEKTGAARPSAKAAQQAAPAQAPNDVTAVKGPHSIDQRNHQKYMDFVQKGGGQDPAANPSPAAAGPSRDQSALDSIMMPHHVAQYAKAQHQAFHHGSRGDMDSYNKFSQIADQHKALAQTHGATDAHFNTAMQKGGTKVPAVRGPATKMGPSAVGKAVASATPGQMGRAARGAGGHALRRSEPELKAIMSNPILRTMQKALDNMSMVGSAMGSEMGGSSAGPTIAMSTSPGRSMQDDPATRGEGPSSMSAPAPVEPKKSVHEQAADRANAKAAEHEAAGRKDKADAFRKLAAFHMSTKHKSDAAAKKQAEAAHKASQMGRSSRGHGGL
jgi:hypothetical protein